MKEADLIRQLIMKAAKKSMSDASMKAGSGIRKKRKAKPKTVDARGSGIIKRKKKKGGSTRTLSKWQEMVKKYGSGPNRMTFEEISKKYRAKSGGAIKKKKKGIKSTRY